MIETPRYVDLSLILRGFFATAVVWWHTLGYRLDMPALEALNISGRLAVWMFFGLSGYVIGYGFFDSRYRFSVYGLLDYFRRRGRRILPLFWLATAVALALLWAANRPATTGFRQLLALQWQHTDYPVGVFWTLGVELQFYLLAPLIAWAMLAAGRWWLLVSGGLWLTLWLAFGDVPDDRSMFGNLQHFIAGMVVARAYLAGYLDRLQTRRGAMTATALGLVTIGAANVLYHDQQFWTLHASLISDLAIISLLVVHCGVARGQIAPGRLARALMVMGILAYGLYAWHGVLLTVWPGLAESFAATFGISVAAAWLSYTAFERPVLKFGKRLSRRPITTPLPARPLASSNSESPQ